VNLSTSPPQAESPIPLPGTSPRAIAISKDGTTAYVLDATNATVIPINLESSNVGAAAALHCAKMGDPGCTPTAIVIGQNGKNAYVAAAGSNDVLELSIPSLRVVRVLPTGGYPDALGLVPGWLFVADGAGDDLTVSHHGTHSVSPFSYPFGVAVVPGAVGGSGRSEGPTNATVRGSSQPPAGARIIPTGPPRPFYGAPLG
jgi:DNA-binding beta-propeller fold protein YncE